MNRIVPDGQPCSAGCLSHVSHPCEKCGRVNGIGRGIRLADFIGDFGDIVSSGATMTDAELQLNAERMRELFDELSCPLLATRYHQPCMATVDPEPLCSCGYDGPFRGEVYAKDGGRMVSEVVCPECGNVISLTLEIVHDEGE